MIFLIGSHDSIHGITTYISSESRRRAPGESITTWFLREGFDWGVAELQLRFDNVKLHAEALENEAVLDWLIARGRTLDDDIGKVHSGLDLLKTTGTGHIRSIVSMERRMSIVPGNEYSAVIACLTDDDLRDALVKKDKTKVVKHLKDYGITFDDDDKKGFDLLFSFDWSALEYLERRVGRSPDMG